jgi:hypothetical protein
LVGGLKTYYGLCPPILNLLGGVFFKELLFVAKMAIIHKKMQKTSDCRHYKPHTRTCLVGREDEVRSTFFLAGKILAKGKKIE